MTSVTLMKTFGSQLRFTLHFTLHLLQLMFRCHHPILDGAKEVSSLGVDSFNFPSIPLFERKLPFSDFERHLRLEFSLDTNRRLVPGYPIGLYNGGNHHPTGSTTLFNEDCHVVAAFLFAAATIFATFAIAGRGIGVDD